MADFMRKTLSQLCAKPSPREYEHQDDDLRLAFQRDRDRILWSHALSALLTRPRCSPLMGTTSCAAGSHSIEVMQLAATITRAFGLDPDLVEAGALAHDFGHPPFGHAGEHALNSVLNQISSQLGGFNHYEHGADVVRWLEKAYVSPGIGGFPGLNLTCETIECIIKHTYYRRGNQLGQTEVLGRSKHKDIMKDTSASLEAQAIRLADKLSYMISDLEDGIRLGIIAESDLRACRLFDHPPIDMRQTEGEHYRSAFISAPRSRYGSSWRTSWLRRTTRFRSLAP